MANRERQPGACTGLEIYGGMYYNTIEKFFLTKIGNVVRLIVCKIISATMLITKGRIRMSIEEKTEALTETREKISSSKAYSRLVKLFDDGTFNEIDAFVRSTDGYAEVVAAHGSVDGLGVYAFAQNSDEAGGAMSKAQAAKIKKVYDLALKTGEPVVAIYDSIGGRLDEGADLLASYGDVLKFSNNLSGVVPQISLVLGKCFGTQALIAACADIVVMSEDALMSLDTSGADADAKSNAKHGVAHILSKRLRCL